MLLSMFYIVLAALGLGFLVCIHELGHYFMARRVGMRVEAFSIGFGKALWSWEWKGVQWKLCLLPFGGYVRIAGMEKKGGVEPSQVPDGFYGKAPWQRMLVAAMGPVTNVLFALAAFACIWLGGGLEKPFAETTRLVGWVDPQSPLSTRDGVMPGDELLSYGGTPIESIGELIYRALLGAKRGALEGLHHDLLQDTTAPFSFELSSSALIEKGFPALIPASYLLCAHAVDTSQIAESGLKPGDRLLWTEGELLFSSMQLKQLINKPQALLTVMREGRTLLLRAPRVPIASLTLPREMEGELDDWRYEAGLKRGELSFIPYQVAGDGTVEGPLTYHNRGGEGESSLLPLLPGDRIIAVEGRRVTGGGELLRALQEQRLRLIVQREEQPSPLSWKEADSAFLKEVDVAHLRALIALAGESEELAQRGNLLLLTPILPRPYPSIAPAERERLLRAIDKIGDPQQRELALQTLEEEEHGLKLGVVLQDRKVVYNPSPLHQVGSVFAQTWKTITSLFSGHLSPATIQGPIGIVQVMQQYGWSKGVKEALFWMSFISVNLALLNMLPLPILDGGHLCMALIEWVRKKPLKAKTMDRLVIPFLIFFILFFIYVTYQDIVRILHKWL